MAALVADSSGHLNAPNNSCWQRDPNRRARAGREGDRGFSDRLTIVIRIRYLSDLSVVEYEK